MREVSETILCGFLALSLLITMLDFIAKDGNSPLGALALAGSVLVAWLHIRWSDREYLNRLELRAPEQEPTDRHEKQTPRLPEQPERPLRPEQGQPPYWLEDCYRPQKRPKIYRPLDRGNNQ